MWKRLGATKIINFRNLGGSASNCLPASLTTFSVLAAAAAGRRWWMMSRGKNGLIILSLIRNEPTYLYFSSSISISLLGGACYRFPFLSYCSCCFNVCNSPSLCVCTFQQINHLLASLPACLSLGDPACRRLTDDYKLCGIDRTNASLILML